MKRTFLERLREGIMLGDGAMGTMIYSRGVFINRCYDELNLSQPEIIREIHREYIAAGAEIIETNTFGANPLLLRLHGLEEKTREINVRGAEIAREAALGREVYIAGSMGPTGRILESGVVESAERLEEAFRLQAEALVEGGVDVLILETFYSLEELLLALEAVKGAVDVPVIAQFTFDPHQQARFDSSGVTAREVAERLTAAGADVVGTNCGAGPAVLLKIVEGMVRGTHLPVSVYANAGVVEEHGGRMMCLGTSPEYMAEYARRYAQVGARLIGGCCGTTPEMIAEMGKFLKGVSAAVRSREFVKVVEAVAGREAVPLRERSGLGAMLSGSKGGKKLVSVELSPPLGTDPRKLVEGARMLRDGGVDVVNIPDGPRAVPRMSPIASGKLVRDEVGIEVIVHYCCRDRNLLGMQMDLLGAHALGLHNVMLITGDPPKIGGVQRASPVFDVDAIGLIKLVNDLNHGRGLAGTDIQGQTQFVIGAGCNPGAVDIETEVRRFGEKRAAGAEFFFSQPVYLPELLERFLKLTEAWADVPLFVGILPLASLRNAEFLHNEVPGMQIPEEILERLRRARTKEAQQAEGIAIAQEMLREAVGHPRVRGIYMFPPFGRYESVLKVLEAM
ncbi:MAG: bifunctional homocysteine S-methyltransferase/methylenetetrahydrofolate reductase [bacterium]|nr:bifunctional homocysteine S-methyltransferase/methylenetetrahydrofolate reductase [bacterium]